MEGVRMMKMTKLAAILLVLFVLGSLPAQAQPVIDGKFEGSSEGYNVGWYVNLEVEGDTKKGDPPRIPVAEPGQLWTYQATPSSSFYAALILPRTLVDNSYGDNIVNWPRSHSYGDLKGSDEAEIRVTDSGGTTLFGFTIDYLNDDKAPFFAEVKDAKYADDTSIADGLIRGSTSQVYNMVTYGSYGGPTTLKDDSPPTVDSTSYVITEPALSGWVFDVIYEFCVDSSVMSQLSNAAFDILHVSPNKIGKNKVYDDLTQIPAPGAVLLGMLGLSVAGIKLRRFA